MDEPELRGKGFAHQIVHQAWERWRQDAVLHGTPLGGRVDLGNASLVEQGPCIRGPLSRSRETLQWGRIGWEVQIDAKKATLVATLVVEF